MNTQPSDAEIKQEIEDRLSRIKNKVVVLSGKGGVGKSTVAVNLAVGLALEGKKVGLIDVDVHGPSIPKLLNLENVKLQATEDGKIIPIGFGENLKIVSIGFFLQNSDDPIIWRGPLKMSYIRQVVKDVIWEDLDYLIFDCPPGTGDEPLSVVQVISDVTGAVIVTTPQQVSISDVRKSVNFCHQLNMPIVGVVENMSGLLCPHCNKEINLFKKGGGEEMAKEMEIPYLGHIPLDPNVVESGDSGKPFIYYNDKEKTAEYMKTIVNKVIETVEK